MSIPTNSQSLKKSPQPAPGRAVSVVTEETDSSHNYGRFKLLLLLCNYAAQVGAALDETPLK